MAPQKPPLSLVEQNGSTANSKSEFSVHIIIAMTQHTKKHDSNSAIFPQKQQQKNVFFAVEN